MEGRDSCWGWTLLCFILLLDFVLVELRDVNCTEVALRKCGNKSKFHDTVKFDRSACSDLNYCESQHCYVSDKTEWNCLLHKARMIDTDARFCWNSDDTNYYAEVCVFAGDDYDCSPNCKMTGSNQLHCKKESKIHRESCIPSLVYCSPHLDNISCAFQLTVNLQKAFFENCFELPYESEQEKEKIWYYFDRTHHDNISQEYSPIMPVIPSRVGDTERVHQILCPELPLYGVVLLTFFALLMVSIPIYAGWKFGEYICQQQKRFDNSWVKTEHSLLKNILAMVQDDDPHPDLTQELIPEYISPVTSENDESLVGSSRKVSEVSCENGLPHQDDIATDHKDATSKFIPEYVSPVMLENDDSLMGSSQTVSQVSCENGLLHQGDCATYHDSTTPKFIPEYVSPKMLENDNSLVGSSRIVSQLSCENSLSHEDDAASGTIGKVIERNRNTSMYSANSSERFALQ